MSEEYGKVTMYVTTWCPYCVRAKALLKRKGVVVDEINIEEQPIDRAELARKAGGQRTVPQIWVGTEHVGGCDDLQALDRRGALDPLLETQGIARG